MPLIMRSKTHLLINILVLVHNPFHDNKCDQLGGFLWENFRINNWYDCIPIIKYLSANVSSTDLFAREIDELYKESITKTIITPESRLKKIKILSYNRMENRRSM